MVSVKIKGPFKGVTALFLYNIPASKTFEKMALLRFRFIV